MQKVMFQTLRRNTVSDRADDLFKLKETAIHCRVDRLFAKLMVIQWLVAVAAALWISPQAWIGIEGDIQWHLWAAVFLGGAIAAFPVCLAVLCPGRKLTRHSVAVAQMLFSALLIHLTGGRIETHFHVFGSLAFLSFYRDWRVLVTATAVAAVDHAVRGMFFPQSVFGVLASSNWRWMEHTAWMIFEDVFLFISIRQGTAEMREVASRRASLETSERRLEQAQRVAHVGSWEWDVTQHTMQWSNEQFRLCGLDAERCTPTYDLHFSCVHPEDRAAVSAWIHEVRISKDAARINHRVVKPDGTIRVLHSRAHVVVDDEDRVVRVVGTSQDITERQRAEDSFRVSEVKFRSVTQSVGDAIISADEAGHIVLWNRAAELMFGYSETEAIGQPFMLILSERSRKANSLTLTTLPESEDQHVLPAVEFRGVRKDGGEFSIEITLSRWKTCEGWVHTAIVRDISRRRQVEEALLWANEELERRVAERTTELTATNGKLQEEIIERKEAQAKLEAVHKQLLDSSRRAGMAEVATSVLHNVGNVLNSVNVSCSVIASTVRKSGLEHLTRTADTLQASAGNLAEFFASDPTGKKLPEFLGLLAKRMHIEQSSMLTELKALSQNIDHIKEIVSMQQNYGRVAGVTEMVKLTDLVDDSLRLNDGALKRYGLETIREYDDVPALNVEKHKILQILVNLIRNAKHACDESGKAEKKMTVRVLNGQRSIRVEVSDNGVGIPEENLTRIFSLGFTTRKDGHGYGLHSAVIAAQELGGRLTVHSDGPGTGATFTLELPVEPPGTK
jgi:PAS domain S-box-containing protein